MIEPTSLISVAMATRNGEAYLPGQLESLASQTWASIEVVASDDASDDRTLEILESYRDRLALRVLPGRERVGVVRNFERAIAECRGEYIALCDQDDLWEPVKLERLVSALGGAALAYCRSGVLCPDGDRTEDPQYAALRRFLLARGSGRPLEHLLATWWIRNHSVLFRADLRKHLLPVPDFVTWLEDWLGWVAAATGGLRFVDEELQLHRRHRESFTSREKSALPRGIGRCRRILTGAARREWRTRCRAETRRLDELERRFALSRAEARAARKLRLYFGAGTGSTSRWQSLRAAFGVLPLVVTQRGIVGRVQFLLRPVLLA